MLIVRVLAVTVGLSLASSLCAQPKALPKRLAAVISKTSPGATIVSAKEIDSIACQPPTDSPGIIQGDFNGDNRLDYAALLKVNVSKDETIWEGKRLREAQFVLMLFLDDGRGGFTVKTLHRYDDFVPTAVVIELKPPGIVRNRETEQTIRISHVAVTLVFCEKSATTYYLAGEKIESIPVAD